MRRLLPTAALLCALACAYVLPPSWRAFRVESDDVPPAVTRALDASQLDVERWDPAQDEMSTGWLRLSDGIEQTRERYVISWEKNEDDGTLTVYVRHEAQDRDGAVGGDWSPVYHDADKEAALLDAITAEIEAQAAAGPRAPE